MRLKNFEVSGWIELQTGNLFWDIHNSAEFEGLELVSAYDAVVMKWSTPNGLIHGAAPETIRRE